MFRDVSMSTCMGATSFNKMQTVFIDFVPCVNKLIDSGAVLFSQLAIFILREFESITSTNWTKSDASGRVQ